MPRDFHHEALTFNLDTRHQITIRGAELRFVWLTNGVATFHAAEDPHRTVAYEIAELNRLNRAGEIEVIPYGLMPGHLRPLPVQEDQGVFIAGLTPAHRARVAWRYAMVRGFEELKAIGAVNGTDESIAANMEEIRTAAEPYLQEALPDPEYSLKLRNWEAGKGRKPRTPYQTPRPGACSPRALRGWVSLQRRTEVPAHGCQRQGTIRRSCGSAGTLVDLRHAGDAGHRQWCRLQVARAALHGVENLEIAPGYK